MPPAYLKGLGARIARLRTLQGLTRAALASRVGISWRQLGKIERGEVEGLPLMRVVELAAELNVPMTHLIEPGHTPTPLTPDQARWQNEARQRMSDGLDVDPNDMPKAKK